jgi:hypothetical protein
MNEDYKTMYCEKCKKETRHIRTGFRRVFEEQKWRCLVCQEI